MHIPDDPLFYEKYYFTPGDAAADAAMRVSAQANGFRVWKTRYATIGVLICWDQWFPEAARITSLLGADILFYPTAIGWHPAEKAEFGDAQVDAWRTDAARARHRQRRVRRGAESRRARGRAGTEGLEFFGHSFIADPFGRVLAEAGTATGDARRDVRSAADRGDAPQLAVPARPAHRRVRADSQPLSRQLTHVRRDPRNPRTTALGFPREWEPHDATWIAWPHHEPDWPGKLEPIPWVYAEIVRVLAEHERVEILCHDEDVRDRARQATRSARRRATTIACTSCRPTACGSAIRARPASSDDAGRRAPA